MCSERLKIHSLRELDEQFERAFSEAADEAGKLTVLRKVKTSLLPLIPLARDEENRMAMAEEGFNSDGLCSDVENRWGKRAKGLGYDIGNNS